MDRRTGPLPLAVLISMALLSPFAAAASPQKTSAAPAKAKAAVEVVVPIKQPAPTPPVGEESGWELVYANGGGQDPVGSRDKLADAIRTPPQEVGVAFASFHGPISGVCKQTSLGTDQELHCELNIWCNQANEYSIPERHGHKAHLRSDGTVSFFVVTLNERGEEKILGLGDQEGTVAWYTRTETARR